MSGKQGKLSFISLSAFTNKQMIEDNFLNRSVLGKIQALVTKSIQKVLFSSCFQNSLFLKKQLWKTNKQKTVVQKIISKTTKKLLLRVLFFMLLVIYNFLLRIDFFYYFIALRFLAATDTSDFTAKFKLKIIIRNIYSPHSYTQDN